ncbi:protein RALF-like 22 [Ananas comosus]|uniref:Protein RALF-like 19 n=1 Tax=Ananas comosus TaxID=4615 RepID=A0A199W4Y5_ANACO|nr:protein RALF-like 22 [Ananas comosus]OAY84374.1 Protein RALF-like 19 [Ananas comosus]
MALIRPVFLLLLPLLLLSLAFAAVSTTLDAADAAASRDTDWELASIGPDEDFEEETALRTCGSGTAAGECSSAAIGEDDDGDDATVEATDAEEGANVSRRGLAGAYPAGRTRFISYGALTKNRVPCSQRGHSYYNCRPRRRANPYHRGCSVITHCARNLH